MPRRPLGGGAAGEGKRDLKLVGGERISTSTPDNGHRTRPFGSLPFLRRAQAPVGYSCVGVGSGRLQARGLVGKIPTDQAKSTKALTDERSRSCGGVVVRQRGAMVS